MGIGKFKILNRLYKKHLVSLLGRELAEKAPKFYLYSHMFDKGYEKACGATANLFQSYDVGVALATDGLYLGWLAKNFGLPVLNVKLDRIGRGATWRPIDIIGEDNIKDKKVIVFENDCLTGKTLRRVARELEKLSPSCVDLMLLLERTAVNTNRYRNGKVPLDLPSPTDVFNEIFGEKIGNYFATGWGATANDLRVDYKVDCGFFSYEESVLRPWSSILGSISCRKNVPDFFGQVKTVQADFEENSAVNDLESKLRIK